METQEPLEKQADVVIIGGGIAGCASAYYLARRGAKVVLVEKGQIGSEQSGRNWGFVRQQGRHPLEIPLMMEGNRLWMDLERELNADIEWVQGGNLRLAPNEREMARLEKIVKEERDLGLDIRLLSKSEVQALIPQMEGPWGVGGMYTPSDGHAEPIKATTALARAAQECGARIYTYCAAEGIEVAGGRVISVVTERGEIKTPVVLCAAGAWASKVGRMVGLELPQRKVRATVAATSPVAPITRAGVWGGKVSFRQKKDGRFYIAGGGTADYDITLESFRHLPMFLPNYLKNWRNLRLHIGAELLKDIACTLPWASAGQHPFAHTVDVEPKPNLQKVKRSREALIELFPSLQGIGIERTWAGYIDTTPDAVPVLGEVPSLQGFIFATGFSGHGFAMGPIVGKLMAELILDGKPSVDVHGLRYSRFVEGALAEAREAI
ncbi:MAG: FAD-binding oxidoreductase [Candidatus Tectomicrobia bacterium]|nr:FAD-binding oxidoreductase [Candidatus Tectomicrobia bacterium]